MTRSAINGMGRMGKLVLRALIEERWPGELVLLNDPVGDTAQHAQLLEFDSVHGRWRAEFEHDAESLTVNGCRMRMTHQRRIEDLPLAELGIDIVVDCTGMFKRSEERRGGKEWVSKGRYRWSPDH